jgi:hypothetical protein
MTLDGIASSPNGLPAMYEYRSSNADSLAFGTIDKPSFLWAGGMYLQVLYRLFAVDENEWNIGIRDQLPSQFDSVSCALTFGGMRQLLIHGTSDEPEMLKADGIGVPSRILPLDLSSTSRWESSKGRRSEPILTTANAIVYSAKYDSATNRIFCDVSSFDGHTTALKFVSKNTPKKCTVDGKTHRKSTTTHADNGLFQTTVVFPGSQKRQHVMLFF